MSGVTEQVNAADSGQPRTSRLTAHRPPAVDDGNPPSGFAALRRELAPKPGRLGNTLRITGLVMACVTLSEVFRMPDAALSAYIVFFVSKGEAVSTIVGAAVAGMAVVSAVFVTIAVFMISLAEPALRIPLIALMTFAAMFLSRTSPLGPIFFAAGFIIAYGLTLGDSVLQLSLAPAFASNISGVRALPELAFIPPEEALVHFLLWLAVAVAMPICLVIGTNLATGRDPELLWRSEMCARLDAAARFCTGDAGARAVLARLAGQGTGGLVKLAHLAGLRHKDARRSEAAAALSHAAGRLCVVLLARARLPGALQAVDLSPAGAACQDIAHAVLGGRLSASAPVPLVRAPAAGAVRPLAVELNRILQAMAQPFGDAAQAQTADAKPPAARASRATHRLIVPDAFSNPAHARFAFKVTLAVMLCYIGESLADWPGIHTCIITCFFVSLDTVGETVRKAALRLIGCLIGSALGLATILLLMPVITDIGDLLLVIGAVTLLAGWVATGSERISYAGWQIAIAFYLATLQGFGPTLDMETARDRIVGILIGNLVVFVIFTTIWPARVADAVRRGLAAGLDQLAGLMAAAPAPGTAATCAGFVESIEQASALLINDPYDVHVPNRGTPRPIDAGLLHRVQALMVPVSVILILDESPEWRLLEDAPRAAVLSYHHAMGDWLHRCAAWVRSGSGADAMMASLPQPPTDDELEAGAGPAREHGAERAAWYGVLRDDLRAILDDVAPRAHA